MPTFKEQQQKLTQLQHVLAVWEFLYSHLDTNFVSRDDRKVENALRVTDCLVDIVPEEVIEDVLQFIGSGPVKEYKKQIESIESQDLTTGK